MDFKLDIETLINVVKQNEILQNDEKFKSKSLKKRLEDFMEYVVHKEISKDGTSNDEGFVSLDFLGLNLNETISEIRDKINKLVKERIVSSKVPKVDGVAIGSKEYISNIDKLLRDSDMNYFEIKSELKNKYITQDILKKIYEDLKNNKDYIDNISDGDFNRLRDKIHSLADQCGVEDPNVHYLRNYLNRVPKTLVDMISVQKNLPEDKKWTLLEPSKALYHMYGEDGEYNVKFVSSDEKFEAVYNTKTGALLTGENDPVNMGTYNFYGPNSNPIKHFYFDMMPYYKWGNTEETTYPGIGTELRNIKVFNTSEGEDGAKAKYNNLKEKIN